ncbi:MAG: hypothetical protein RLZ98_3585 [Pseudomonadota bacterium]|jgi:hypothetical protein
MVLVLMIWGVLLVVSGIAHAGSDDAGAKQIAPTLAVEIFMQHRYPEHWRHRAVAIGPAGVFASAYRARSDAAARQEALDKCREKLTWHPVTELRALGCRIYAIGDKVVWQSRKPEARPLELVWRNEPGYGGGGIVLHLPDCRHVTNAEWKDTWTDHLTLNGFAIGVAKADADCPPTTWGRERMLGKMRDALGATLRDIRQKHPEAKLTVWADGIAGDAVHALADVQGARIVTTNTSCAYGGSGETLLPAATQVTALVAAKDFDLHRVARDAGMQDIGMYCARVAQKRSATKTVVVAGKGRFPAFADEVGGMLGEVFDVAPIALKPADPRSLAILPYEAHLEFNRVFRMFDAKRAFVISTHGRSFFGTGHTTTAEAVQTALWRCNRAETGNGFKPGRGCVVFALDEEVVIDNPARAAAMIAAESNAR